MIEMFEFWMAKILVEIGFVIALIVVAALGVLVWSIPTWYHQWRCKHEKYYETRACDAICYECGKNLGFIGSLRDKK